MYNIQDNIVALATVPGKSALNVVRCSGAGVLDLYLNLTNTKTLPKPNFVHLSSFYQKKQIIDQGMVVFFKSPKSFTGQDMLEISVHGGRLVVKKLLLTIGVLGFRQAMPGEFSYRSFISGKMDLVQAEAVSALIESNSNLDALYSINNIRGALSKQIKNISTELRRLVVYMEHELDFTEEEIAFIEMGEYKTKIICLKQKVEDVLEKSFLSNEIKGSVDICIIGKTNVGKSSLFNRLLGYGRSIVTKRAGTTTDTVSAGLMLNETSVDLIDTAGIRKTRKEIESKGIKRTYQTIKKADIVLFVDDKNPKKESKAFQAILNQKKVVYIQNKRDQYKEKNDKTTFKVSCTKGTGISRLFTALSTLVDNISSDFLKQNLFIINERQRQHLNRLGRDLGCAVSHINEKVELDVLASSLRGAYEDFSGLLRPKNKDEIINNIFKDFCVGK